MSILTDYLQEEVEKNKKNNKKKKQGKKAPETIKGCLEEYPINADKCTWCTNCGKFTHPSANTAAAILVPYDRNCHDGTIHTANVVCERDISVNATYLPTARLLALMLEDGRNVFQHFKDNSEQLQREIVAIGVNFEKARAEALKAKEGSTPSDTDDLLRQVFFPLGDGDYHLLSILPSSSLMMAVRTRVQAMEQKARDAKDEESDRYGQKHQCLPNLVCIGIGGTKPQNISYLNTKYGGKTYMLLSVPPEIEKREVTRPRKDFFLETLHRWQFRDLFQVLHDCYARTQKNMETQQKARAAEEHIIDKVLAYADRLRALPAGWTDGRNVALPKAQRVWLDEKYVEQRNEEPEWKQEVADSVAKWVLRSYEIILKDKAFELSDTELSFLRKEILQAL